MKIAIVGASGKAGSRIASEALSRGHEVTAISRHPEAAPKHAKLTGKQADADNVAELAAALRGHDVIVSSLRFIDSDPHKLLAAVKQSGVKRYLIVGGAGSLEVAPGKDLIDQPGFPEVAKPEAGPGREFLRMLRKENDLDWVMLSPSAIFAPGERTGKFRVGGDTLLTAADGKSHVSMEDYAIALLDEIEKPKHHKARFTVGY
jgi:putative NADH-flavin reductase